MTDKEVSDFIAKNVDPEEYGSALAEDLAVRVYEDAAFEAFLKKVYGEEAYKRDRLKDD